MQPPLVRCEREHLDQRRRGRVGEGAVTGPARLWSDHDHEHVRLEVLERLSRVLDLHPTELFAPPTRVAQRRAIPPPEAAADPQVVEAAPATVVGGRGGEDERWPVSRVALAGALGWPLARVDTAVAALDEDLADRGQRVDLDDRHGVVGLWPRAGLLSQDQSVALHRLRAAREVGGPDDDVDPRARPLRDRAPPQPPHGERHRAALR